LDSSAPRRHSRSRSRSLSRSRSRRSHRRSRRSSHRRSRRSHRRSRRSHRRSRRSRRSHRRSRCSRSSSHLASRPPPCLSGHPKLKPYMASLWPAAGGPGKCRLMYHLLHRRLHHGTGHHRSGSLLQFGRSRSRRGATGSISSSSGRGLGRVLDRGHGRRHDQSPTPRHLSSG
jgi:hypothetical protein